MALSCRLRVFARRLCTEAAEPVPAKKEKLQKRIANYFLNIFNDYKFVAEEIVQDVRDEPVKSSFYISGILAGVYLFKTNPSEADYKVRLIEHSQALLQVGTPIRNPTSDTHMQRMLRYYNMGQMRRTTFGLFSIMWWDNYEKSVSVYPARAPSLQVGWLEWKDRVVDVGYNGKWHWLDKAMIDYDINPNEWPEEEKTSKESGK